jgi:hypothetical protein
MIENWEGGFVLDSFLVGWIWISFKKYFLSVGEFKRNCYCKIKINVRHMKGKQ